jgi:predicted Zn-dependent protease
MRPLVVISLYLCAWAAFPPAFSGQNPAPADVHGFLKAARRALAHGKPAEAESLARARPAGDAAAAAVLAQIAIRHGRYEEALGLLEPAVAREPAGEAALELALLHLRLGRAQSASRLLNGVYRQAATASDP